MSAKTVKLANNSGFCFGVNRAVDMLTRLIDDGKKVCTLGPIIHNPQVISDFEKKGVKVIERAQECPEDYTLVIRTHGITKEELEYIKSHHKNYLNITCPYVSKIHSLVKNNSDIDNILLIAGDGNHPEVKGIKSYAKGKVYTINNIEEFNNIIDSDYDIFKKKIILVSQTTFNKSIFELFKKKLNLLSTNHLIFDTICSATGERQKEAIELSKSCDAVIVIGGRKSSNTSKLKTLCAENCPTFLIETADELKDIDLSDYSSIGVTAGASTPDSIIKEVLRNV